MRWLIALSTALLIVIPGRASALDCDAATPLPDDVRLVPPASDVPEAMARFAGAWTGTWRDKQGKDLRCTALVVEEVYGNGFARVVYALGVIPAPGSGLPYVWRITGRIVDGVLHAMVPTVSRTSLAYRVDGPGLAATTSAGDAGGLQRTGDVAALRCVRPARAGAAPPGGGTRDRLTAAELMSSTAPDGPVHNDYFVPVGPVAPAKHALRGTLTFPASWLEGERHGCAIMPRKTPAGSLAFFTHGDHLVPVVRETGSGTLLVGTGRVWSEPADGGMSRASFPFTMINPMTNSAYNGLATFLFDDTSVSSLRVQVVQETAPWGEVDLWGRIHLTYAPGAIPDEAALRTQFADELRRQTPIRPWSALPASPALAAFDGDAAPAEISANGMVVDGVLYVRGCHTRYGPYPYCREMRHGVFSVTKSAAGAVALLRLAQKYGEAVLHEKLVDHLPAGAAPAGWQAVTFADALNMATGMGDEGRERDGPIAADENRPKMIKWAYLKSAAEKIRAGLDAGQYSWKPGEVLRYNSVHTFLLAAAMDAYLKRREGPGAHLWDMVRDEVLRPIGIAHAPKQHTIEPDGSRGLPLLGYGLYLTVDDVAKIATLLHGGGRHDGVQLLHPKLLDAALFRTSTGAGLPNSARNRFGEGRYHLSFWSAPYRDRHGCSFQVPYMAGLGGNLVALLPNGITVFRFADANHYDLDTMILAGESIRPFCPAPAAASIPPSPVPLTAAQLAAEVPGHTFTFGRQRLYFAPGGRLYGAFAATEGDLGTWAIENGRLCRAWTVWDHGLRRCWVVSRDGDAFVLENPERFTRAVGSRKVGGLEP